MDAPDPTADLDAVEAALRSLPSDRGSLGEAGRASMVLLRRDIGRLQESYAAAATELGSAIARAMNAERERDQGVIEHTVSNGTLADRIRELEAQLAEQRGIKAGFLGEVGAIVHEYATLLDSLSASLRAKAG